VGSSTTGSNNWLGEIGHFYLNLTQALDLSILANRQKFINGNNPVSLGRNGEIVTGAFPTFYFDGAAPAWNNQGSGPGIPATGTLAAGTIPLLNSAGG
jgi:hypothetical protein